MPKSRRHPSDALLCENCGYDLHGLTHDDVCPECGIRARDSLPESHPGAPWQGKGVFRVQRRTMLALIVNSKSAFARARPVDDQTMTNQLACIGLTVVTVAAPIMLLGVVIMAMEWDREAGGELLGVGVVSIVYAIVVIGIVAIVTIIVLWLIARLMRVRTPNLAAGHAMLAWTCCWPTGVALVMGGIVTAPFIFLMILLTFAGFLFLLATFVASAFGMRGMRYANPPGAERHLRDHAGEANISTAPESARRM